MKIVFKGLVKGVSSREYDGKVSHSIEAYGTDGKPCDVTIDVDMNTQRAVYDTVAKAVGRVYNFTCELTRWNQRHYLHLLEISEAR